MKNIALSSQAHLSITGGADINQPLCEAGGAARDQVNAAPMSEEFEDQKKQTKRRPPILCRD